ncbi:MAG: hypothetical protein K1W22_03860 [Lachnospiraceae bacterium]
MAACGNRGGGEVVEVDVPSIDKLNGDDYKDLKADVKILTGETPQNKFSSARRRREAMRWHR